MDCFEREKEKSSVNKETGSLLSQEDIDTLASFDEGSSGYFYKMLDYLISFIRSGIEEGRFTEQQAYEDLQIALWYAYGCLNIDEYEYYYRAAQWMPDSEKNAKGCGMWYYRYSVALMYCGRLEEALRYGEKGGEEEPDYPWIWLQIGKLRSHFGNKDGALKAVDQGLSLVPGDHEFLTLKKEIENGDSLEQMEYHWIDPDFDKKLQEGLDQNQYSKLQAISCITASQEGLEAFFQLFHPEEDYRKDGPYCSFSYSIHEHKVRLVFKMNEAGLSKLNRQWLEIQKARLDDGRWLLQPVGEGKTGVLDAVVFGLNRQVNLVCRIPGEEQYFQIWLSEDGTPASPPISMGEEGWPQEEYPAAEVYSGDEIDVIQKHIETYFGDFESVWHELVSPDIHVDICLIPPAWERNYHILVTMGMGAHRMNVPKELADQKLERAELAIALPSDWKLDQESLQDEKWYWPIRLLKVLARLPKAEDSWLGWGHTVENEEPFASNTRLCGSLLLRPQGIRDGGEVCVLPDGSLVNFYQVIPLYQDEMEYKKEWGAESLLDKMRDISFVVHPNRPEAIADEDIDEGSQWIAPRGN